MILRDISLFLCMVMILRDISLFLCTLNGRSYLHQNSSATSLSCTKTILQNTSVSMLSLLVIRVLTYTILSFYCFEVL